MKKDIGFFIKNIHDKLERLANAQFASVGLTGAQVRVLIFLAHQKNCETTQKELETFLDVSHPTINGILHRMEDKGFITTNITKKDGHLSKTVSITEAGKKVLRETDKGKAVHEKMLSSYLTKDERETLIDLLTKVRKAAEEMEK